MRIENDTAVIEVAQNQRDQALVDARQGVALSPDSAAAEIALSYALQANFQINEARDILQQAVTQHPDDALARARLAELQLMLGDREQATASAQQAATLAPEPACAARGAAPAWPPGAVRGSRRA